MNTPPTIGQIAHMGTVPGTNGGTDPEPVESALVADIEGVPDEGRWLIEGLWSAAGVGIVGGTPKTGKTWFTLELAVSVASGVAALDCFEVPSSGPVVVFPAEDDPRAVRDRVAGIAAHKGVVLEGLPLHLITARALRLDEDGDRRGLAAMLDRVRPKLVVLDPLVRLHGGDENYAGHIAELLGFLRSLQREFGCAILLTHHITKRRSSKGAQMGQALRGSGELHAWGDSNIYLTRTKEGLVRVELEHRSAPSPEPAFVKLRVGESGTWLERVDVLEDDEEEAEPRGAGPRKRTSTKPSSTKSVRAQVVELMEELDEPISQARLREHIRVRNQRLTEVLHELAAEGLIERPGGKRRWSRAVQGE